MNSEKTLALDIMNLNKSYGEFSLKDMSFQVPKGSIVGLVGENGAGKSTTINAALNIIKKDGGKVRFFGQEMTDKDKKLRNDIGVVFDNINFSSVLKIKNIESICRATFENWDRDRWNHYMKLFGINQDKKVEQLSKGMKVKVSLAVSLCHGAKLLILDEPTSGLDPIIRDEILDIFLDYVQDEENAILLSSHITTDLEKVADYIVFIHDGQKVFQLPKDEIIYQYGILKCPKDQLSLMEKEDVVAYKMEDYQCSILVKDRAYVEEKYGSILSDYVMDSATIENVMLFYIRGKRI